MEWIDVGYWSLFFATFLAATVIPFSSEAILGAMVLGDFDALTLLIVATAGNTLGGMTSFGLGYLGNWRAISRYLGTKEEKVERWKRSIDAYGAYTALLCWVPFIGDVIAVALGIFKTNVWRTLFWMTMGKGLRYGVILWVLY